jgi:hypothetical protein
MRFRRRVHHQILRESGVMGRDAQVAVMEPEPDDAGQDVLTFVFPEGTRIRIE